MKKLLCVIGPTASGKTGLAVNLAKWFGGEVVSCDSMQVYRGMDIGTAKPSEQERKGVAHHMLDVAEPGEDYSAGRYARAASECVEDIFKRGKLPIVCGGTGLYLKALTQGLSDIPDCPRLDHGENAYAELREADPETASRLSPNDMVRIGRALDVWKATGKPLSWFHANKPEPSYGPVCIGIRFPDRQELYGRIDRRVDKMMADGLLGETAGLLAKGVSRGSGAMQAIGYREAAACLNGEITHEEAVRMIKQASRRYAKRQITWFGAVEGTMWFEGENIFTQSSNFVEIQHLI